jgi:hypothetical protein
VSQEAHRTVPCRLCGATSVELFRGVVLSKYAIGYFRCEACGSLETEPPHWLAEAYAAHNLAEADTGAVVRNLDCQATVYAVARILRFRPNAAVLDFGGGNGLLCRLLRDCGFDARIHDPHAVNDFAQGFEDDGRHYDIVCAFEVAEHFPNPREDMSRLFGRAPDLCMLGTGTYEGQGSDWWYLTPASGQHVFFYSHQGMEALAHLYGYKYFRAGDVHLFLNRPFTRRETALLRYSLGGDRLKWVRAYLALRASYGRAERDALTFETMSKGGEKHTSPL